MANAHAIKLIGLVYFRRASRFIRGHLISRIQRDSTGSKHHCEFQLILELMIVSQNVLWPESDCHFECFFTLDILGPGSLAMTTLCLTKSYDLRGPAKATLETLVRAPRAGRRGRSP